MAAITTLTQYSDPLENNSFEGKGIQAFTQAYAATSAPVLKAAKEQHVCYAQLTGAMTINPDLSNLKQFDKVVFHFNADGTNRIVTFGTGMASSGTLTVTATKDATVQCIYDGAQLKVVSREVTA